MKLLGMMFSGTLMTFGTWIIAQVDSPDDIPQLIGGVTVLSVSYFIVRWVLSTSKQVEEKWIAEIARLDKKVLDQEATNAKLEAESDAWREKYWNLWAQFHGERSPDERG